jgi:hypothetical protein
VLIQLYVNTKSLLNLLEDIQLPPTAVGRDSLPGPQATQALERKASLALPARAQYKTSSYSVSLTLVYSIAVTTQNVTSASEVKKRKVKLSLCLIN